MELRIVTWNLQGRERPDLDGVADVIDRLGADIALIQEVQRRQAGGLADRLGWHAWWSWKHWPLVFPPEGMAILCPEPPTECAKLQLAHRWRFWSSKRRIALAATARGVQLINVHLGHEVHDDEQSRQATLALSLATAHTPTVLGGDFNALPGSPVFSLTEEAGFHDTWTDGESQHQPSFWGSRRDGGPRRCIDYVLLRGGATAQIPIAGFGTDSDWSALRRLSDHAPVTVTVSLDAPAAGA